MNSPGRTLHVVIVNYRSAEMTADTVRYVNASDLDDCEVVIWIVDNGSGGKDSTELAQAFPDANVISSARNLGFAAGNNMALARILPPISPPDRQRTFILLLNSDVQVCPDAIQQCLDFLDEHPEAGVVGPKVMLPSGELDLACRRGFPTLSNSFWKLTGLSRRYPDSRKFAGYNLTYLPDDETCEVDAVGGAFMLVRVAAIDDAGVLDERFFMYGEDLDWAYRIKTAGWKVFYFPEASVLHLKSATARRQSRKMIFEFYRAMWLFHAKHYGPQTIFAVNWLVMIAIVARGVVAQVVNSFRAAENKRFT
jgi:N-acetylglucosaminyl-diphospho-decaprenol L-rhamnosyltransferase